MNMIKLMLVSLGDANYGILPEKQARAAAHEIADAIGQVVRLRDIITDRTIEVIRPRIVVRGRR